MHSVRERIAALSEEKSIQHFSNLARHETASLYYFANKQNFLSIGHRINYCVAIPTNIVAKFWYYPDIPQRKKNLLGFAVCSGGAIVPLKAKNHHSARHYKMCVSLYELSCVDEQCIKRLISPVCQSV